MLSLLLAYAFAATDTRIQGCWSGEVAGGRVELILSQDPKVADAVWFYDGGTKLLANIHCSRKQPVICAIEDDGGKFNLQMNRKLRMSYRGRFVRVTADGGDRLALEKGKSDSSVLRKVSDDDCREKTKELFKIFGLGP